MPGPMAPAMSKQQIFVLIAAVQLMFIAGTYAQIGTKFALDGTLAGVAAVIVNVMGLILYATLFRKKIVPLATFILSFVFVGMAAAGGAWG